ncbi:3-isopropylmalate dehydratase small subunit [Halobacteriales archaeon QS_4_70_19]|nr:MAG: 3-isopropylmalate dehydratase small subunit [Halobacteriales archaeon QS_4_70_19]
MSDPTEEIPEVDHVEGTGIPIRGNDIDTDQIIPARFMKVVTFDGLGQFSFFDQRFDSATPEESQREDSEARSASDRSSGQSPREDGEAVVDADNEKDHPMNEERFQDANVMVVNNNFGCGSSREHAPQALMRWGIDALIGEGFAEIFAGNCLALGIPTVTADHETIDDLQQWVDDNPDGEIEVDVAAETVAYGGQEIGVSVDDAQRKALVDGIWDTTALMKANEQAIAETAADLPYVGSD